MTDTELLNFLDENKQYVVGFAPSKDFCLFDINTQASAYGPTVRACIE